MTKYISYNKLSSKRRKEINSAKRKTWGFCPATRIKQNGKIYNRKKTRYRDFKDFLTVSFLFALFMPHYD